MFGIFSLRALVYFKYKLITTDCLNLFSGRMEMMFTAGFFFFFTLSYCSCDVQKQIA